MLKTLDEVSEIISGGNYLHISGSKKLLKKLPRGNWIGGSIEYFMSEEGGVITDEKLFVNEIPSSVCKISVYDENDIENITKDAYQNGFTLIILPAKSQVLSVYAKRAPGFENIYMKNIAGWVSGCNQDSDDKIPATANGLTGEIFADKAIALHVKLPESLVADIGIINIFKPDENSPIIEFTEDSFYQEKCLVDGAETFLLDFIKEKGLDTKLPFIGDYLGANINAAISSIDGGVVSFGSPVFEGIKYRLSAKIDDYPAEFRRSLLPFHNLDAVFSCNCNLNFFYGELLGKQLPCFHGPMSFGEVAYQLLNQTLVYVVIKERDL